MDQPSAPLGHPQALKFIERRCHLIVDDRSLTTVMKYGQIVRLTRSLPESERAPLWRQVELWLKRGA